MMRLAVGKPRPLPRCFVVKNGSNIFSHTSGLSPSPRSAIPTSADWQSAARPPRSAPSPHRLGRVEQEVEKNNFELGAVNPHGGIVAGDLYVDIDQTRVTPKHGDGIGQQ